MENKLTIAFAPHLKSPDTTSGVMLDVIISLLPACVFGCILFGWKAFAVVAISVISAVLSEFLWNKILKKPNTVADLSAVVTGLLLGMNLPSEIPLWMPAFGSAFAIIVVKQIFGGIGCNVVNPAITARILMLVSFPTAMTRFIEPVSDAVSSATPLVSTVDNLPTVKNLFFGMHSGSIGETSAFLLIVGGVYLIIRRIISPIIPLCFIGTAALFTLISGDSIAVAIFGGGLMLGAVFMATDYTTSPITPLGKAIFGFGCGIFTFIIRKLGSLPEGVSYSILIMNILVPYIDKLTLKKPFGYIKPEKKKTKFDFLKYITLIKDTINGFISKCFSKREKD